MHRTIRSALLLFTLVFLLAPSTSGAQGTPTAAQQALVRAELEKRGLTEEEARSRLVQEGIIVENIPLSEYPAYRQRIGAILDALAAEKRAQAAEVAPSAPITAVASTAQTSTVAEAAADARQRVLAQLPDSTAIYGHGIFTDQSLDVFRTTDGARAPDTYILGPGDLVRVTIFGASQADLQLEIGPDGFVQPAGTPRVFLQGLTLPQARALLRSRLAGFYRFNSDQIAITIQTARTVTVNVFGESRVRGSFTVSALNTAFNALAVAGGPTSIGSVRRIQLVRGTVTREIDVYRFMTDPTVAFDFDLRHNDVLLVPPAQKVVAVRGPVRRPMRYELVEGEGLRELIRFAGGLEFDTYAEFVQVQRVEGDEVVLREWRLADVLDGRTAVPLRDGDIVRVREIGRPLQRVVYVSGAVFYPGRFDLGTSASVQELLARAQLRPEAADIGFLVRRDSLDRNEVRYRRVNLRQADRMSLQQGDSLIVYDRGLFTEIGELSIGGAVRNRTATNFDPSLTIADLVMLAGGMTLRASTERIDVIRPNFSGTRGTTFDLITVRVDSAQRIVDGPPGFRLAPFDQVIVRERPLFNLNRVVHLEGQVLYPGRYALATELTYLSDVIDQAGGLTEFANPDHATLRRSEGRVGTIGIEMREALRNRRNPEVDPILVEGDSVFIPRRENVVTIRLDGTRIGEIRQAGLVTEGSLRRDDFTSFVFEGPRNARWYLEQYAGGFSSKADRRSVTVTDPSGRVRGTQRALFFFNRYPTVQPGSTISLRDKREPPPSEQRKVDWDAVFSRSTQVLTSVLTLIIVADRL
jgi:polysaccharide biosynthesis/export protein